MTQKRANPASRSELSNHDAGTGLLWVMENESLPQSGEMFIATDHSNHIPHRAKCRAFRSMRLEKEKRRISINIKCLRHSSCGLLTPLPKSLRTKTSRASGGDDSDLAEKSAI